MSRTIYLVSCVASKRDVSSKARDLYTSPWFRKARALAERRSDAWYVLSAKYGLLHPDTEVAPYEQTLNTMPSRERKAWAAKVITSLRGVLHSGDTAVFLAGRRYREHLVGPLKDAGVTVDVPMQGLGIGQQLAWMKAELQR